MININSPHLARHRVGSITFEEKLVVVNEPPVLSYLLYYPEEDIECVIHPLWCILILLCRGGVEYLQSSHHVLLQLVASYEDSFSEIETIYFIFNVLRVCSYFK